MRVTPADEAAWIEGVVNRRGDHISIAYGEDRRPVALVARRARKGFTVQFLLKPRRADERSSRILSDVRGELTFYLHDVVGPDAWAFAQYHCTTPANQRSLVHWRWHPKAAGRRAPAPALLS